MSTRISALPGSAARTPGARYVACLRLTEILVLQGPPLLGAAFALRPPLSAHAGSLALLVAADVCLVAHVFAVNDWANLRVDLADPHKTSRVFTAHGVDRGGMARLAWILLAVALLLCSLLGPAAVGLALGVAAFSALYSLPAFDWKGTPLLNSTAHLGGGTLHFLLGYALGSGLDGRGLAIAAFFALIFAAGHLTQEIRDHHGDRRAGIRTNAVRFGQHRTFAASLILFGVAHALLFTLALSGVVPQALAVLVLFYAIHLRWSLDTLAGGLSHERIRQLQTRYRLLYAVVGVAMIATLWLR